MNEEKKIGISGSTLKIIAIVIMLIDHLAAGFLVKSILGDINFQFKGVERETLVDIYYLMRHIGRIAFPIFIFLLVEGFLHTRDKLQYIKRLWIFAFVSELPFDLAFNMEMHMVKTGCVMEFSHQNVFFTLAIGLATIWLIDLIGKKFDSVNGMLKGFMGGAVAFLGITIADVCSTDYRGFGVLAIVVMYLCKKNPIIGMVLTCGVLCLMDKSEAWALFGVIPVALYNGTRGLKLKWIFYLFYPVHLFIIFAMEMWL